MKNKKRIGIILGIALLVISVMMAIKNNKLTKSQEANIYVTDSLFSELQKKDSLLIIIQQKEDSLINQTTDTITKIKKVYEKRIDNINSLTINEQVQLLSKNLSQDTINWK